MIKRILCGLICLAFVFTGCKSEKREESVEFMRINGTEVSKEEFQIYFEETRLSFEEIGGGDIWETDFDGRTAFEVAKESALNSMMAVKISAQKAEEIGLMLDAKEKMKAEKGALELLETYEEKGIEITESLKEAMKVVMKDKEFYELLRHHVVKDYVVSESEFQIYYDNYFEDTAKAMRQIILWIASCDEEEIAQGVYEEALEEKNLEGFFKRYDTGEVEGVKTEIYEVYQEDIDGELIQILEGGEGFVTRPTESYDGKWKVIRVTKIEDSTKEEVEEKLREDYTNTMWQQIFSKELEKWIGESSIERNDVSWKEVS